jgi:glycosyltransferase involved in cell wall biosynthesis
VELGRDVIILNPDAIVNAGAITEMYQVSYLDPMIGFVSPRSNNAGICSLPHQDRYKMMSPSDSLASFRHLSPYLPRFQFIPFATGSCLFIRWNILTEFGLLDEGFGNGFTGGHGYTEIHDLIMRANRCGYRVALANRAWIYSSVTTGGSIARPAKDIREENHDGRLSQRYPESEWGIQRYLNGERYEAERVLAGLLADSEGRQDLLFDFSSMGRHHNGTSMLSKEILARAPTFWRQFNIYVMVSEEARRFHELDQFERVQFVPVDVERRFAVALRLVQPFALEHLSRLSRLAPVNVYGMLDPIMFDCLYLNSGNPDDLETLWAAVFSHADGVIYISDFAYELFHKRFRRRKGLRESVVYPSLDVEDYKSGLGHRSEGEQHILVFGNRSDHKRVRVTVEALSRAFPDEKIVSVGSQIEAGQNVVSFSSGYLSRQQIHQLFSSARLVVYPSLYEGFGLPILESLAYEKPVLARSIPAIRAIREKIRTPDNLILFSATSELVELLRLGFPTWRSNVEFGCGVLPGNWDAATSQIGDFLAKAVCSVDFENVLMSRIGYMHLLGQRAEATGDLTPIFGAPQEMVQRIYASWSWRLTAPLRWLGSAYLRVKKQ